MTTARAAPSATPTTAAPSIEDGAAAPTMAPSPSNSERSEHESGLGAGLAAFVSESAAAKMAGETDMLVDECHLQSHFPEMTIMRQPSLVTENVVCAKSPPQRQRRRRREHHQRWTRRRQCTCVNARKAADPPRRRLLMTPPRTCHRRRTGQLLCSGSASSVQFGPCLG